MAPSRSSCPGAAKSVPLYAKSYALVIGIDNYTNGWPRLAGAIKDAETVAEVLKQQGFEVRLEKDLDRKSLTAVLEEWFIFAGQDPDARLLVWFAGHGHTIERKGFAPNGYIVAADAPSPFSQSEPERLSAESRFKERALSLTRFGEFMKEANARHVLVVFDSCFSGTIFHATRAALPAAISRYTTLPVRQFVTSGTAGQKVSDDGQFRRLFIGAITGLEPEANPNRDPYVTGNELGNFLQQKVTNLSAGRQTPLFGPMNEQGYDQGDFVFQVREEAPRPTTAAGSPVKVQPLEAAVLDVRKRAPGCQADRGLSARVSGDAVPHDRGRRARRVARRAAARCAGRISLPATSTWSRCSTGPIARRWAPAATTVPSAAARWLGARRRSQSRARTWAPRSNGPGRSRCRI